MEMTKPTTLTPKQENFCLAYLETGNASEAYRRAYDVANMKPESIAPKDHNAAILAALARKHAKE